MNVSPSASRSASERPMLSAATRSASVTPRIGSDGVVGALNMRNAPAASSTSRSVNVPPVSTAKRIVVSCKPAWALWGDARPDGKAPHSRSTGLRVCRSRAYHRRWCRGARTMTIKGRAALITGGSQGIGEAIARRLAAEGVKVGIVASSDIAKARAIAETLPGAVPYAADVRDAAAVAALVARAESDLGGIDILVNNAGV